MEEISKIQLENEKSMKKEKIEKISQMLQNHMKKSDIPENFYLYLSNMIFEDPPRNK